VALHALTDPGLVGSEIAQVAGEDLSGAELLLVIDNFEQLLEAAPELSLLLASSPRTKLVVTSRAALRIRGEHELTVPPLASEPSVELFVRRARAHNPRLALGDGDEALIAEICRRLDGLPLAIELAAARTKVLSPRAMHDRLAKRLDLLSAGPRDAPLRQQTLRAAIGWSYDLLDAPARATFDRLGVFSGGFTLEAAEAVCGLDALDTVAALVDHSLLFGSGGRLGMLETVREFALDRLGTSGALAAARAAHARYYADLVAPVEQAMDSAGAKTWLDRLETERENVRAAIDFAVGEGDATTALTLCANVWRYWERRGSLTEGREALAAALGVPDGPPALRQRALNGAGALAGDAGDFAAAKVHFEESLALARDLGEHYRAAFVEGNLGTLALFASDYEEAIRRYEGATAYARSVGNVRGLSLSLQNLGIAHAGAGQHGRAVELLTESVELARRTDDTAHLGSALRTLARLLLDDAGGDAGPALGLMHEAMEISRELRDRPGLSECFDTLARVAGRHGDARLGTHLLGASAALRAASGRPVPSDERPWVEATEAELRAALGDPAFSERLREGGELPVAEALERALAMSAAHRVA
jgi:predicted ATPase